MARKNKAFKAYSRKNSRFYLKTGYTKSGRKSVQASSLHGKKKNIYTYPK